LGDRFSVATLPVGKLASQSSGVTAPHLDGGHEAAEEYSCGYGSDERSFCDTKKEAKYTGS